MPAIEGGSWQPARSPPPPAAAILAGRDDWNRLNCLLAGNGGRVRHDLEPRRPAIGQDLRRTHARDRNGRGCGRHHSRHVPPLRRRLPGCVDSGPRPQVHECRLPGLRNGVIGESLRAFANGRKDDRDISDGLTPLFIDRDASAHPRLPFTAPAAGGGGSEYTGQYAQRMRELELSVQVTDS